MIEAKISRDSDYSYSNVLGLDGQEFIIYFDNEFLPGKSISYDEQYGQVLDVVKVKKTTIGDYKTTVKLKDSYNSYFIPGNIKRDTQYLSIQ